VPPPIRLPAQPKADLIRIAAADLSPPPSLESMAKERLLTIVPGLAVLHLLVALTCVPKLKLLFGGLLQPEPNPLWPALSAPLVSVVTCAFLLALRLLLPRLPLRWADPLGALVSTLVVINSLCWMVAGGTPDRTAFLALALVCTGFFLFSAAWLGLVAFVAAGGWVLMMWLAGFPPGWLSFALLLAAAVLLSFLVQRLQHTTLRQLLSGRAYSTLLGFPGALSPEEVDERFRAWYEATSEGIALHDHGTIIEANPMLGRLLGCSQEELAGHNLLEWFTQTSRSVVQESILLGNFRPFEAVVRRADGTEMPLELFSKELPYKGRLVMVTAFRDVSERQRAIAAGMAERRRLEEQFQRQTALAQIAFNIDQPGEVSQVLNHITQAAAHLRTAEGSACLLLHAESGPSLAAAQLNPRFTLLGFSPVTQLAAVMEWIAEHRETFVAANISHDDPFNVNQPVPALGAYVGQPIFEQGKVLGVLFVLEEQPCQFQPDDLDFLNGLAERASQVISKTQLCEELRQANALLEERGAELQAKNRELGKAKEAADAVSKAKSEFLATISHELRTPLNGVLGMTSLLLQTKLSSEQHDYADTLHASAKTLLTSINQILDFIEVDANAHKPQTTLFNVRKLVSDTFDLYRARANGKPVQFHSLLTDSLPAQVRGQADALRQVLNHLFDNAVKFTEHGDIAVGATRQSESNGRLLLRFTVSDTGIGIPPEAQGRLFDSFTQVDGSSSRRHGGLGLGLAISKQLVERLGGTIGVDSTPGQGSTFWFLLPFEEA
jgi:PAS domain S-box-containing protein